MPTIQKGRGVTVVALYQVEPRELDEILPLVEAMSAVCAKQPGFVSAVLHVSEKKDRVLQYFQWKTMADNLASQRPEVWEGQTKAGALWKRIQEGTVKLDAQVYEVATIFEP
jgi:hypothetical protein